LAAIALIALLAAAPAAQEPPDCEALYYGDGVARDYKRALACFRAEPDWLMVAVMQLNGEGTPVDVAGARKSLEADEKEKGDEDQGAATEDQILLEAIIKKREADPKARGPRVDFCKDVAGTTLTMNWCEARALEEENRAKQARIKEMRSRLDKSEWPAFDKLAAAFEPFVAAESKRAYQQYIDGTIRASFSMSQEKLVREHFVALVKRLSGDAEAVPKAARSFAEADAELNAVYRDEVRSTAGGWEEIAARITDKGIARTNRQYADDYRKLSRAAQHEWIRYRDAAGKLAATRWPKAAGVEDAVRALVTDDRIRELRNSEGH
jgi:hypothetical protein